MNNMNNIINTVDFITTTVMANYPIHWLIENWGLMLLANNLRMDWKLYRLIGKLCYFKHCETMDKIGEISI